MDSLMILTQGANGILKPIARLLGLLMNGIYVFLDNFLNIQNIALAIIIFTVVIYLFMLPLTYQQQKFSKMSQIMNPEIQKIQKKYKNRKDSASVQAMNEETQAVYKKYGVNPSGSCIFMVIQLLILFPLYRIIYNVPGYVTRVRDTFTGVVDGIMNTSNYDSIMNNFLTQVSDGNPVFRGITYTAGGGEETRNSIIDILYRCTADDWNTLANIGDFSGFSDVINSTQSAIEHFNNFLGASIVYSPKTLITTSFNEGHFLFILIAILIPVIAAGSQLLNIRLMPQQTAGGQQEAMAAQMKMMNYFMPIYSFFIVFFLPIGVGVYWIAGSVIRLVQQLIINHHFNKIDMAKLVKENEEKAAKKAKEKAEKKGVSGETIANAAKINTRQINAPKHRSITEKANSVSKSSSADTGAKKYKEGSMAAKANKVREFNEKNSK